MLDDEPYTVIGVMPPAFSFPRREVELWVPLVLTADDYGDRNNNELYAVGRLKPGATLEQRARRRWTCSRRRAAGSIRRRTRTPARR